MHYLLSFLFGLFSILTPFAHKQLNSPQTKRSWPMHIQDQNPETFQLRNNYDEINENRNKFSSAEPKQTEYKNDLERLINCISIPLCIDAFHISNLRTALQCTVVQTAIMHR